MNYSDRPALCAVADDAYAWTQPDGSWWVNNAGAVTGPDGVVVIDTCATETRTRALLTALASATGDAPIPFAVNTHQHGDHAYGNSLLPDTTVIISHPAARAELLADPVIDGCPPFWNPVPDWGKVTRRPPTLTVNDGLVLHHGNTQIELHHPGHAAHTTGDLVAWLPRQRVLYTGDLLFHQVTPLVFMGSAEGALRALDWIAAFDPDHVIPGHGPLIGRAELSAALDVHRRYYNLVLSAAHAGIRGGLSPLDTAIRCDLGQFAALPDAERIVLNLHRAYADITGATTDMIKAFNDTVTYNGGPMHTIV